MSPAKTAVLFPGTGYTCDKPLLRVCAEAYEARGFDIVRLDYGAVDFSAIDTFDEAIEVVWPAVSRQLCALPTGGDTVFVSKSFGCTMAGYAEKRLGLAVRHLFLTPNEPALPYIDTPAHVLAAVIGTEDPHLDHRRLEAHCRERHIPCLVVPGVGHRLERADAPEENARILDAVRALCGS